eukprot:TRINITY_DN4698_c0_g1_i2.p1 TRINITY_DN4698_c0_g1~~TRINITY_DN4698_c0_g1_i2.p1  ORF type:complete len:271 (+),score=80.28 TRINITY_DN4698_c0_g1_i2:30-815(+)
MEEALPQEPPQKRSRTAAQQQQCAKDGEASLLEAYNKMKQQQLDWRRRESALVLRLTTKEQEIHELQTLVHDLRGKQCGPTTKGSCNTQQTCGYVDPVLNANYTSMREQLKEYEKEIKSQKEQLAAVPVTNESITTRKLIARCKALQDENEELGKQVAEGHVAQLEQALALRKKVAEEYQKSISEYDALIRQTDEEADALQSTVWALTTENRALRGALGLVRAAEVLAVHAPGQEQHQSAPLPDAKPTITVAKQEPPLSQF